MTLRVIFGGDNFLVREGVSALLWKAAEIELVATVADPDAAAPGAAAPTVSP